MKISVIKNNCQNYKIKNQKLYFKQKLDSFEKRNFKTSLPYEITKNIPKGFSYDDLIALAQNDAHLCGVGANSKVYNIPYLNEYVLKVLNKNDPNGVIIGEFPTTVNLGQPVWQDEKNPRLIILKKVEGNEHSIPSWTHTIWDDSIKKPLLVTKEQVKTYFASVEKLANMPQEAFNELAYKVLLLSEKGYKVDSINPNNLIVDNDEIHIIDYFKVKPWEKDVYQNCSYDLIAIALDFTLLPEYFEKMDSDEQSQFLKNAKIIFDKIQNGANHAGLTTNVEIYKTFINETSKWFVPMSAFENDGREHVRLYDYRANDFLIWLDNLENV